jgi:hypothetical protein
MKDFQNILRVVNKIKYQHKTVMVLKQIKIKRNKKMYQLMK